MGFSLKSLGKQSTAKKWLTPLSGFLDQGFQQPQMGQTGMPSLESQLALLESLRGQERDLINKPLDPQSQMAALGPMLDAELNRVRNQAQMAKGSAAGNAEQRGLTFSDVALGQLGGIDMGAMQSEQDLRANMLAQALNMEQARRQAMLGSLGNQMNQTFGLAQQRDQQNMDYQNALAAFQIAEQNRQYGSMRDELMGAGSVVGSIFGKGMGGGGGQSQAQPPQSGSYMNQGYNSRAMYSQPQQAPQYYPVQQQQYPMAPAMYRQPQQAPTYY